MRVVADHMWVNDDAGTVWAPGVVDIADGVIQDARPMRGDRPAGPDVTDLGDAIVLPGLVNAHAHTPMHLIRGVAEGVSLLGMEGFISTLRSREAHLTPELVGSAVLAACADMIESGTTAFADQYFYADEITPRVREAGLRARVAWGIVELGDDDIRARELASTAAFLRDNPAEGLVQGWVGPHAFFVDNTLDAMEVELELAQRHGVGMHAHFGTRGEEDRWCRERFGVSALAKLAALGMFEVPTILAHGNSIAPDELPHLAGTRAALSVIPSVAMTSGVEAAPVRQALDAGVTVALGSDNVCNNTNTDLFEEMRILGRLAAFVDRTPNSVTPREILRIATVGGHRAIAGGPSDGTLVPGAVADLIALPRVALHRGPDGAQSLASALVYGASGQAVTDTMVAGEWLQRDGRLLTIDRATVLAGVQADFDVLAARMEER